MMRAILHNQLILYTAIQDGIEIARDISRRLPVPKIKLALRPSKKNTKDPLWNKCGGTIMDCLYLYFRGNIARKVTLFLLVANQALIKFIVRMCSGGVGCVLVIVVIVVIVVIGVIVVIVVIVVFFVL
jgi:hypothetical protein